MTNCENRPDEAPPGPVVTLSVVQGAGSGARYRYQDRTTALVGRAEDCDPCIAEPGPSRISRHHCLFDINPPDIRVRDFGSLNGTHVNGEKIGSRDPGESPEQGAQRLFPERDLQDGDRITLGDTVFEVAITMPESASTLVPTAGPRECSVCGDPVADDPHRTGREVVCARCQGDRGAAIEALLRRLVAGQVELPDIEGYELVEKLGDGGQGVVYLARRHGTGELVAIKMMLARVAVSERSRMMFDREISSIQALNHPNVVGFRESGRAGAAWFFTSEYCAGGSVADLVERQGLLPPEQAVTLVRQALDGLQYAHTVVLPSGATGLVHRDIKPANILLAHEQGGMVAKVADFGLSKAFDEAGLSGMTMTGTVGGTVPFMARPQAVSFKYAKPDVDVWSMAASLYWMLTGYYPREFPRDQDPIRMVLDTSAIPIRQRSPHVPARLAEVIDEALVDKPQIPIKSAARLSALLGESL